MAYESPGQPDLPDMAVSDPVLNDLDHKPGMEDRGEQDCISPLLCDQFFAAQFVEGSAALMVLSGLDFMGSLRPMYDWLVEFGLWGLFGNPSISPGLQYGYG